MKSLFPDMLTGQKKFVIKSFGTSMLPTIHPGDVVYLRKISFQSVKNNDIVLVKKENKPVIHRVIYKKGSEFCFTKGDNNARSDGKVLPRHIIGKVYQVKRKGLIIDLEHMYLFQSTLYFHEIVKVKKAFEKENIDYVILKGLPLHLYFEKTHPRRIYADCDVLVDCHPERSEGSHNSFEISRMRERFLAMLGMTTDSSYTYKAIRRIFKRLGYHESESAYSPIHKLLKNKPTEISFYKVINNFPISFDIHFEPVFLMNQLGSLNALYPDKYMKQMTDDFLQSKRTIKVQGELFSILSKHHSIVYLAMHFFHHNFRGIYRLEFLDRVIRKSLLIPSHRGNPYMPATPDVFLSLSDKIVEYRLKNFIYPGFLFLKKYYHTPIPKTFLHLITPSVSVREYIKKQIMTISPFDDETRVQAGVRRFFAIFSLSPRPLLWRFLIFFDPAVIFSVVWVSYKKMWYPYKLMRVHISLSHDQLDKLSDLALGLGQIFFGSLVVPYLIPSLDKPPISILVLGLLTVLALWIFSIKIMR